MSKITLEKGSWGDWTAYIDGEEAKVSNGVLLDRAELLERVLAKMGIEVECMWHYYITETDENGKEHGVRYEGSSTNMKEKV